MATLEELQDALINADKAGDTQAAQMLADEIVRMQSQPQTMLGADRAQANDAQVAEQTAVGRREAYNQKPWYSQALQAADDEARLLSSGITMGFGDKFSAYMNSGDRSYADQLKIEREATQAARDRASSAAIPSEIAGAVMTGSLAANSGATLAGRLGTANMTGWRGLLARAGLMAPEGAVYGAVDAAGNDKNIKEGAITGAIAGPAGSVLGDAAGAIVSRVMPRRPGTQQIPDLQGLRDQARRAYDQADQAGVIVNPQSVQRLQQNIINELTDFGYHPQLQPGIGAVLHDLDRISQGNVTLRGVDVLRRIANNARQTNNPSERAAANIVIEQIDNYVNGLGAQDLVAGNNMQGVNALRQARELWTRVAKNERFTNSIQSAQLRAESNQVNNIDSATRQNVRKLIDPASRTAPRNWTADERNALNGIVRGTIDQRALRWLGKLAPTGVVSGGLGTSMGAGLGAFVGGPAGAAVGATTLPLLGAAAKYTSDRSVLAAVQHMDQLIRSGGNEANLQAMQGALRQLTQAQREAVARIVQMAIIQTEVGQQEPAQQ
jgi:hypothetical protein